MSTIVLTQEEKEIYTLIREYLKKKPFFLLEEIIMYLNSILKKNENFTRYHITLILKSLMKKMYVIPGTKLVRDDILEVPKRVEIFDYITAMPGSNFSEILQFHGFGVNHVLWHLKWLEKFEFIRVERFGNKKAYFKYDFEKKYDEVFFYLRNTKIKKIIKLLKEEQSPVKPLQISDSLNIHYNTVKKYLTILIKFNLLMELDEEQKNQYLLNPEMLTVIQNVIDNLK